MAIFVVCDLVGSRGCEDRAQLQDRFIDASGRQDWPLHVTRGDEACGTPPSLADAVAFIQQFPQEIQWPVRFGVGQGTISDSQSPRQCYGSGVDAAHAALSRAKKRRTPTACFTGFKDDDLLDAVFYLTTALRAKWTPRQASLAAAFARSGSQVGVARAFDVSEATLSQSLDSSLARQVLDLERIAVGS